jgi:hypothetical protein
MQLSYKHVAQPELSTASTLPGQHCIHTRVRFNLQSSSIIFNTPEFFALSFPTKP